MYLLRGLRILELPCGLAGAYAGKLLRDLGADVTIVDPDTLARSVLYRFLHRGKRAVSSVDDIDADVVIAAPGATLGGYAGTVVHISPFGSSGPWAGRPATEFTLGAWAGAAFGRGMPDRPPIGAGVNIGEHAAGALAALFAVAYAGRSVTVDLSVLESLVMVSGVGGLSAQLAGVIAGRRNVEVPSIEPAADGYVGFAIVTAQQLQDFWLLIGKHEWIDHPDYLAMAQRWARRVEVWDAVRAYTRAHSVAEIVEQAAFLRIPCVPVGNGASLPVTDHFVETGAFERVGGLLGPVPPFKFGADGDPAVWSAAAGPSRPLEGIRVTAFTAFWAGPYAACLLRALGADVVTIESVQRPDGIRFQSSRPPSDDNWWEYSGVFHGNNAGKRGVALNIDDPRGRAIAESLIARSDVVIENYSARVLDNFGFGYEVLAQLKPDLVMCRMPAFGLSGPWRDRTAFAMTIEQASGMGWMTGYPDRDPVVPRGACDPLAGIHAALATVAALDYRRRTGLGQQVEVSMIGAALNVTAQQVLEYDAYGTLLQRNGNAGHGALVQGMFRCLDRDDPALDSDCYVAIAAETPDHVQSLVSVVGGADHALIETWCRTRSGSDVVAALWDAGVPVAEVVPLGASLHNPQLRARGFWERHTHQLIGELDYPGLPARVHGAEPWFDAAAPTLGQHTEEVLCELGFTAEQIAELRADNVIGTRPLRAGKPV